MLAPLKDNARRQQTSVSVTLPACVDGWDASTALAVMPKTRAVQLKNWFPQPGYLEMRRGWTMYARIGALSTTPIETLMAWNGPASKKMFYVGGGSVYDGTVAGTSTGAVVTGLGNSRLHWTNMTTSAGAFLVFCNGSDAPQIYNGTAWSTPSITGTGISASDFIQPHVHKRRLWFVINNSTDVAYLGTDAISGSATKFTMGSLFDRGGYIVAMVTWTLDGGTGPDDYACFITSEGQVAVYGGTDPSSSSTWSLVGVYNLAKPLGRRCAVKYGTTPILLTESGVLQMAMALNNEEAQLKVTSLTQNIVPAINTAARSYNANWGWELCVYPRGTRLIMNIPVQENNTAKQYVMNTLTGAWCEFDAHNANTWLVYDGNLYFGDNTGQVCRADTGAADGSAAITATGQTAYNDFGSASRLKHFKMVQPLILTDTSNRVSVGISADFVETQDISTPSTAVASTSTWDSAKWDQATWGGNASFVSDWTSPAALGRFGSVKFVARSAVANSYWGTATWGTDRWGTYAPEQTLQINGFTVIAEPGGYI